jgi:hypothetical protein
MRADLHRSARIHVEVVTPGSDAGHLGAGGGDERPRPVPARRWTDRQLRDAIATSSTWSEVCRELGLTTRGGATGALRRRCEELGLDHRHLDDPRPRRRWTDEQLTDAVAASTNLRQVFGALGLKIGGGSWMSIQDHIRRLELDTSHWDRPVPARPERRQRRFRWSDDRMLEACRGARSVRQVMERLGLDPDRKLGRRAVERRMREVGVEPRSLPGQAWSLGTAQPRGYREPLAAILVEGRAVSSTAALKKRLLEEGLLTWRCSLCGIDAWRGHPLSLQLDHINGDRWDNRLENLRLLCPNCHSQTDTFAGRNIGNGYSPRRD